MASATNRTYHLANPPLVDVASALSSDAPVVDVRSPAEFNEGSFPNAVNIPVLDDGERCIVGTLYRKEGRDHAVDTGYRMVENGLDSFKKALLSLDKRNLIVMCARGGFRSRSVTAFANELGLAARQLDGGYKRFRNHTLNHLGGIRFPGGLVALHGKTGVGKTRLLEMLDNSLDLEKCARHRGSNFGGIGLASANQKTFESNLLVALRSLDLSKPVFIEGESNKIGKAQIPESIFGQMRNTPHKLLIECPLPIRVERTLEDYGRTFKERPEMFGSQVNEALEKLRKRVEKQKFKEWQVWVSQEEWGKLVLDLYLSHYDPKYRHKYASYEFAQCFPSENLEHCAGSLQRWANSLHHQKKPVRSETPVR